MASESTESRGPISACFHELFVYTVVLKATCARKQPPVAEVRDNVRDLLNRSAQMMRTLGIDPRDYDEARFGVCAWVDETILNMPWTYREEWLKYLLQSEHYATTKAGEEFFERLNMLRPEQSAVREVYYLCLALGFIGRYCAPGDEMLLEQLRRSNLRLLGRAPTDIESLASERVFLDDGGRRPAAAAREPRKFWNLPRLALGVGVPVATLLLFFVYRFVLNGVVENLVGRITGS
jgi:type VI secretion system protein ImpK